MPSWKTHFSRRHSNIPLLFLMWQYSGYDTGPLNRIFSLDIPNLTLLQDENFPWWTCKICRYHLDFRSILQDVYTVHSEYVFQLRSLWRKAARLSTVSCVRCTQTSVYIGVYCAWTAVLLHGHGNVRGIFIFMDFWNKGEKQNISCM